MNQEPWSTELVVLLYLLSDMQGDDTAADQQLVHDLLWGRVAAQKGHGSRGVLDELVSLCNKESIALPMQLDTGDVKRLFGKRDPFLSELQSKQTKELWKQAKKRKLSLVASENKDIILDVLAGCRATVEQSHDYLCPGVAESEVMTKDGPEMRRVPNEDARIVLNLASIRPLAIDFTKLSPSLQALRQLLENYLNALKSDRVLWDTEKRDQAKYRWSDQKKVIDKIFSHLDSYSRHWINHDEFASFLRAFKKDVRRFHPIEDLLILEKDGACHIHEIRTRDGVLDFWMEIPNFVARETGTPSISIREPEVPKGEASAFAGKVRADVAGHVWLKENLQTLDGRYAKALYALFKNSGKLTTYHDLARAEWGDNARDPKKPQCTNLRKYVSIVRVWLKGHRLGKFEIRNVRSQGWIFVEQE
jgi:hypothetical protein